MRLLAALAAAAVAVAAGASTAETAASGQACKEGVITFVGTIQARVFCGPAKATAVYQRKTIRFHQGSCIKAAGYVNVNIGTVVLGVTSKRRPDYFGLVVGRYPGGPADAKEAARDGTYKGGAVAWVHDGKSSPIVNGQTVRITLAGNRSRGTFSGTTLLDKVSRISGSFSC